jgi:hypothetical protein
VFDTVQQANHVRNNSWCLLGSSTHAILACDKFLATRFTSCVHCNEIGTTLSGDTSALAAAAGLYAKPRLQRTYNLKLVMQPLLLAWRHSLYVPVGLVLLVAVSQSCSMAGQAAAGAAAALPAACWLLELMQLR